MMLFMQLAKIALAIILLSAVPAIADDAIPILPTVPTIGISPLLQWALSLFTVVLTVLLPIAVAALKQRVNVANTADRNAMIDRAVRRGALITYSNQLSGASPAAAAASGLNYVQNAVPESINATDQATDKHLANAIAAEVVGLTKSPPPSTVPPVGPFRPPPTLVDVPPPKG